MAFQLFGDQVIFCDFQLFAAGVNAKFNNLHTVAQRAGDTFQTVGRSNEHTARKVEGQFHKVVAEGLVLFAVQHLQQRRGRIAVRVARQFVDLVQKDQRVADAGARHSGNNAAGHSADIGFSVAADVGLVANAAQRDAHVFAIHGAGDRSGNGSFADAGRADQTQNLAAEIGADLLCGNVFHNAFFHLFQTVVILVQNLLHRFCVCAILGFLRPRNFQTNIQVVDEHGGFGRTVRGFIQSIHFFEQLFLYLFGQFRGGDLLFIFVNVRAALAQLFLNHLHLLAQIVFALVAVHPLGNAAANVGLGFHQLGFLTQNHQKHFAARKGVKAFQHGLLVLRTHQNIRRDKIGERAGVGVKPRGVQNIGRAGRQKPQIFFQFAQKFLPAGLAANAAFVGQSHGFANKVGFQVPVCTAVFGNHRAGKSFKNHAGGPVRRAEQLLDLCNRSHAVELVDLRSTARGRLLGGPGQKHKGTAAACRAHGSVRIVVPRFQVEGDRGEGDRSVQDDDRQRDLFRFFNIRGHNRF